MQVGMQVECRGERQSWLRGIRKVSGLRDCEARVPTKGFAKAHRLLKLYGSHPAASARRETLRRAR